MLATLHNFCDWLANTGLSTTIQNVSWIIPTVQTVHIVCVAIVISAVFLVDMRILGVFARGQSLASLSHRFLTWIWYAIIVLLITGTVLIIGEPARSLMNPAFVAKMVMLLTVAALTLVIQRPLAADAGYWDVSGARRATLKGIAVASLALWSYVASY
jgi:hypothetical protein